MAAGGRCAGTAACCPPGRPAPGRCRPGWVNCPPSSSVPVPRGGRGGGGHQRRSRRARGEVLHHQPALVAVHREHPPAVARPVEDRALPLAEVIAPARPDRAGKARQGRGLSCHRALLTRSRGTSQSQPLPKVRRRVSPAGPPAGEAPRWSPVGGTELGVLRRTQPKGRETWWKSDPGSAPATTSGRSSRRRRASAAAARTGAEGWRGAWQSFPRPPWISSGLRSRPPLDTDVAGQCPGSV